MTIKIYSTPTCPYCVQAKNYFKNKKIPFEDVDVSLNKEAAEEMVKISNQMGVPVITLDEKVIIGFDRDKIEKILSSNTKQ